MGKSRLVVCKTRFYLLTKTLSTLKNQFDSSTRNIMLTEAKELQSPISILNMRCPLRKDSSQNNHIFSLKSCSAIINSTRDCFQNQAGSASVRRNIELSSAPAGAERHGGPGGGSRYRVERTNQVWSLI